VNQNVAQARLFEIRRGLARVGSFRGYRPAPVAFSGGVALTAGLLQSWWNPGPIAFVVLWSAAATLGFGTNLLFIARDYGASPRHWERSLAFAALMDLLPAVLAGALLTIVLPATGRVDLLPGLWMLLFGTGVMASRRHLPFPTGFIGVAYVLAGAGTLYFVPGAAALRAEVMAGVFGLGQLVLSLMLERARE